MGECLIPRRTLNKQEYIKLADVVISGSATTNVDISGLNISKEEEIVLMSDIINGTSSNPDIFLYVNANYTNTNYYRQYLVASSTSLQVGRTNNPPIGRLVPSLNAKTFINSSIKFTNNGFLSTQNNSNYNYGTSSLDLDIMAMSSTFTVASITSIRIASGVSGAIGVGSRFTLYKVAQ